jgi:hypothetical protein
MNPEVQCLSYFRSKRRRVCRAHHPLRPHEVVEPVVDYGAFPAPVGPTIMSFMFCLRLKLMFFNTGTPGSYLKRRCQPYPLIMVHDTLSAGVRTSIFVFIKSRSPIADMHLHDRT